MSRKPPSIPPPGVSETKDQNIITQRRYYKVITPLFGGGVKPAEADPVTVVRATEVRGHLRFWWRATRGWSGHTVQALQKEEELIWGSSAAPGKPGPSEVIVQVHVTNKGKAFQAINRHGEPIRNAGHPSSKDGYVAFPLRDQQAPVLLENVEFELKITFPAKRKQDIEASLWAWETFGGIGARTRRGFGAIHCTHVDGNAVALPAKHDVSGYISRGINTHVLTGTHTPEGVPHLSRTLRYKVVTGGGANSSMEAWRYLVGKLQSFRQMRSGRFGRSQWPEPDAIRRITRQAAAKHATPMSRIDKFPRGKFGLPIIYQFKEDDVNLGDPSPTTLQGPDHDRLASPLILRPIVCADGTVGVAAILEWDPAKPGDEAYTPPGGLVLIDDKDNPPVQSNLSPSEAQNIPPLIGKTDILQAFLDTL